MLSQAAVVVQQVFFFPDLKYVVPEALPPPLMSSALASSGSVLELAGIAAVRHRGIFSQLLTEATPVAHPLPKPCHANLVQPPLKAVSISLVVFSIFFGFIV